MNKAFLIGKQVYLRPFERTDIESDYQNWLHDEEITRYLVVGSAPHTYDALVEYYNANAQSTNSFFFAIIAQDSDKIIGTARLFAIDWIHRKAKRGIMIGDKAYWGKGIGGEVINLISSFAFERLNLNKLISGTLAGNVGIHKINERCGYKREGLLRSEEYHVGQYHDVILWGLIREDYEKINKRN
ncbi:GNAT family N-acetyltransferase [Candidatus Omnitrophota bacterium]